MVPLDAHTETEMPTSRVAQPRYAGRRLTPKELGQLAAAFAGPECGDSPEQNMRRFRGMLGLAHDELPEHHEMQTLLTERQGDGAIGISEHLNTTRPAIKRTLSELASFSEGKAASR